MTELKKLSHGFEYIEVTNKVATAKIALQGAHIFSYVRDGQEQLWLSPVSDFEKGKAIRGGVPICWPAFGMSNPTLSQHGFARTSMFEFEGAKELDDETTELLFTLKSSEKSLSIWDYKFALEFRVTIGKTLTMELITANLDEKEFELTEALHTYFPVSNIADVKIKGLMDKPYFDALTSKECVQKGEITFDSEFDVVFQEVDSEIVLEDAIKEVHIKNEGSKSVIVWNPWIEKCSRMSGMNPEAYREFVCIESANARDDKKILKSNGKHTLKTIISE